MDLLFWVTLALCEWFVGAGSPQPNVLSDGKKSGLYIWIYLKDGADIGLVMRRMAKLQTYVDELCPAATCRRTDNDEYDDDVLAGVGFGYDFYTQAVTSFRQNYTYQARRGILGNMPNTGGDIFVHAKSNSHSKLFELSQTVQKNLPAEAVAEFRDTYGFVYKDGRDLSGFIDGTENPSRVTRFAVAVDPETNGSYCMTQEWIHRMDFIASQPASILESFVGRKISDSAELQNKSVSSHVARMTSGATFKAKKPVEVYRQSMPYGTLGSDAGLFFIAFAASTNNFDFMLNRMTGKTEEDSDDIMRISRCVSGNYWYFPSTQELERLQNSPGAGASFRSSRPRQAAIPAMAPKKTDSISLPETRPSGATVFKECISYFSLICLSLLALWGNGL